ncbi:hypothetical protein SNEBB_008888 [Seison nebaliae]|nr:hypothetical protein SNEBB_008888 [Seison nebaliae]
MDNEQAKQVAAAFVQQYYAGFDSENRENLSNFYVPNDECSLMTFEGIQYRGNKNIMEKLNSLTFRKVEHHVTEFDTQLTMDQSILIVVIGLLKTDNDPVHNFTQSFLLKQADQSWYILNDVFRLLLHNNAA